jgi:LacI family transcriptional regulator
MKDVALRAGVSTKTVSRVVNGQGEISAATAARVKAIIDELGYRPNQMARGLAVNRTNSIGFVVPDIINPFYSEVAQVILRTSRTRDYHMVLCSHENSVQEQQSILDSLVAQGVDGIIVFPALGSDTGILRFAQTFNPIVVVNHEVQHSNIGVIRCDIYRGAEMAVDYLAEKGHKHNEMLGATRSPQKRRWRERGFRDAMKRHGHAPSQDMIFPGDHASNDVEGGYLASSELLTNHPEITAIVSYNDMMAFGAIRAAHELGRRIPDDLAIIGFDDISTCEIVQPRLTTIKMDKYQMGSAAVEKLLSMLQGEITGGESTILDVALVIRDSA